MKHVHSSIFKRWSGLFILCISFFPLIGQQFRPQKLFHDNSETCIIADVNNDGRADVIAGRNWFPAPHFIPQPLREIGLHPPDYARNNGEHAWDVDEDGWIDVISTGWGDSHIYWWKNPGKTDLEKGLVWKRFVLADTKNKDGEAAFMMDLDDDGVPEYIMNSYVDDRPFTIWRLEKNIFGDPIMKGHIIGVHNSHGIGFGDMNGDGLMDIVYDRGWYEQPTESMWEQHWKHHTDWKLPGKGSANFQITDIDKDGGIDILYGQGHDYGLYRAEKGVANEWVHTLIDSSWSQVHTTIMVDLDGDGQKELITGKRKFAHSGHDPGSKDEAVIYAYHWDKESELFKRKLIATGVGTGLFIRAGDLNQDGKPDLVVAGKTGSYILWQE